MSTKTDVEAIRLIGDEVVRLLSLSDEALEAEARQGLRLIADLARWRDLAYSVPPRASGKSSSARH
ncbi:hypothetical protein [Pseudomonas extremaustralis]|uniref:hypothetical protein n=1 Tax=Pseudomonas extremaustralis TaxID=359110 RepID=UPI002AA83D23|nr:hypothetical protein [Pseudomonas extremaustralis]